MPLNDQDIDLQAVFQYDDPNLITDQILKSFKEIINKLIIRKKVQIKSFDCEWWTRELSLQRQTIKNQIQQFQVTRSIEDEMLLKNLKNLHTKYMKKTKKEFYRKKMSNHKSKWRTLANNQYREKKTLNHAIIRNKEVTSPKELAEEYMKHLIRKIQLINSSMPNSTIAAEITFK